MQLGTWKGITQEGKNNKNKNTRSNMNQNQGYGSLVNQGMVARIA
jgi:uncharacterized protein with NRDE domain